MIANTILQIEYQTFEIGFKPSRQTLKPKHKKDRR